MRFLLTALSAFAVWLLLTAGTGTIFLWSTPELLAGGFLALLTGAMARSFFCRKGDYRMANPLRWIVLAVYLIGPFFFELTKANLDVAYRVITGRIRPGIVRISPGLSKDLSVMMLANSITLTPGTLTVDVDEENGDLFVHMIHIDQGVEKQAIVGPEDVPSFYRFARWIRRIAE